MSENTPPVVPSPELYYKNPPHGWTCFHCGETFKLPGLAKDHFGADPLAEAACLIKAGHERNLVAAIREAEEQLARYRDEDNDKDREMGALRAEVHEMTVAFAARGDEILHLRAEIARLLQVAQDIGDERQNLIDPPGSSTMEWAEKILVKWRVDWQLSAIGTATDLIRLFASAIEQAERDARAQAMEEAAQWFICVMNLMYRKGRPTPSVLKRENPDA
jgi:hypothetical protein